MTDRAIECHLDYRAPEDLLKGRILLVTGAGDGIGRTAAIDYARHGATVILLGRTTAKLEKVYDEIEAAGGPQPAIFPLNFEGATLKDYHDMAEALDKEFGRLDRNPAQRRAAGPDHAVRAVQPGAVGPGHAGQHQRSHLDDPGAVTPVDQV